MMIKIKGMLIASGQAWYNTEKRVYDFKGGKWNKLVPQTYIDSHGLTDEIIDSCIKKLEKKTFKELCKEVGFVQADGKMVQSGTSNPGLVIVSDINPKVVCSVTMGEMHSPDTFIYGFTEGPVQVSLNWYFDEFSDDGVDSNVQERPIVSQEIKAESIKSNFMESITTGSTVLTESLMETGEADQDYDKSTYDAICKHIAAKTKAKCEHKEFDKYQGVFIKTSKDGIVEKLWTVESFVTGKAKDDGSKYLKANLVDEEGNTYSANKDDYFMSKPSMVFKDHDLLLVLKDGTSETIHNPKVSDLPKGSEISSGVSFEKEPDQVLVLSPEGNDLEKFEVVISPKGVVKDDGGLADYLKNKFKQKGEMEMHLESIVKVDKWGIPMLTESEEKALPKEEIKPVDPEKKAEQADKMADDGAEKLKDGVHVGEKSLAKPVEAGTEDKDEKKLADDEVKPAAAGQKPAHVAAEGRNIKGRMISESLVLRELSFIKNRLSALEESVKVKTESKNETVLNRLEEAKKMARLKMAKKMKEAKEKGSLSDEAKKKLKEKLAKLKK